MIYVAVAIITTKVILNRMRQPEIILRSDRYIETACPHQTREYFLKESE